MTIFQLRPLPADIIRCRNVIVVLVFACVTVSILFLDVHPRLPLCELGNTLCFRSNSVLQPVLEFRKRDQGEVRCEFGDLVYEKYCVFSPYSVNNRLKDFVSLCTHVTVEFVRHVSVQCGRWQGPMSVAVYVPPEDYPEVSRLVSTLRHCDACVRRWVDWHFFFEAKRPPATVDEPTEEQRCDTAAPEKRRSPGPYPINVARNIARERTDTPFVLSLDVELYPSEGALPRFRRMMEDSEDGQGRNDVWVLPVFEVYDNFEAPANKSHLKELYDKKQAISFHRYRCNVCHRIPNITQWFQYRAPGEEGGALSVWKTVKRNDKFSMKYWEPFFFGTQKDPLFNTELISEGMQNKFQMAYEMCLRDYDFHIVDEAFLVHAPGIKVYNSVKYKQRQMYYENNERILSKVKKELKKKYQTLPTVNEC